MRTEENGENPGRGRCLTPDGLGIAVYDFGGRGTDLLLVHATGFCAQMFEPLARALASSFRCWGLDLRFHGRSDRPGDGSHAWSGFATDVLAAIDHLGIDQPAAFGHSCGGAAVLLAEEARPGTFRSIYCFEPVIFAEPVPESALASNPQAPRARRRRETFPSAEEAFINFSSKPPFDALDPECLRLYVEAGFESVPPAEGGDGQAIRLRCRRDDEAEVYAHALSHGAFGRLGEVVCPVTLACGELTDAFDLSFLEADAAQLPHSSVEVVPGLGHFGPLQDPVTVASSVASSVERATVTPW